MGVFARVLGLRAAEVLPFGGGRFSVAGEVERGDGLGECVGLCILFIDRGSFEVEEGRLDVREAGVRRSGWRRPVCVGSGVAASL